MINLFKLIYQKVLKGLKGSLKTFLEARHKPATNINDLGEIALPGSGCPGGLVALECLISSFWGPRRLSKGGAGKGI